MIADARAAVDGEAVAQRRLLIERLSRLPLEEILSFKHHWDAARTRADSWDLVGAAYIIDAYVSDDSFADFRSWLILHGRGIFDRAVEDADSLAGLPVMLVGGLAAADGGSIVPDAYDRAVGRDHAYWDFLDDNRSARRPAEAYAGTRSQPLPSAAAEAQVRWPRLWARYAVPRIAELAADDFRARGWFKPQSRWRAAAAVRPSPRPCTKPLAPAGAWTQAKHMAMPGSLPRAAAPI
jgi:hypothetical protein